MTSATSFPTAAHLDRVIQNFHDFRAVAAATPAEIEIPSCPDWTMRDLTKHMCDVAEFWSAIIDARGETPAPDASATKTPRTDLFERYDSSTAELCDRLSSAPDPSPIWTWLGTKQISPWLVRRLDAETSLHLWDAGGATPEGPKPLAPDFSCDAIDEYFDTVTFTKAPPVSLHLHATDAEGEWFVTADADGNRVVTHEHVKAEVAVRGTASDLLLTLWGRNDVADLDVFGDASTIHAWLKPV